MKHTKEQQQHFLDLYRRYEQVLRDQGLTYFAITERADETLKSKLNMIRQMRNFMTHVDDAGFVEVSDRAIQFLEELIEEQVKCGNTLRKQMIPYKKCGVMSSDTVFSAMVLFTKTDLQWAVVVNASMRFYGLATLSQLTKAYVKEKDCSCSVLSKRTLFTNVIFMKPDVQVADVMRDCFIGTRIVVTEDGTKDGRVLGFYVLNELCDLSLCGCS